MSLENYCSEFIRYIRFEKRLSPHTVLAYTNDLEQLRAYLLLEYEMEEVSQVADIHIRSWLVSMKELKLSGKSLQRKISAVKSLFKYLMRTGVLTANPILSIKVPKAPRSLPVFLEEQQTEALLEQSYSAGFEGGTERLIIELLYQTGMRRGELVQLKESDVEFSRKQIRILGKGNKERMVPVSESLLNDLKLYMENKRKKFSESNKFLLSLKSGKQVYPGYVYQVVKRHLEHVTTLKKRSPHVLRHTFATQLSNNGAELNAIKELLGHSSLAATQIYTHNNIEKLREVYRKAHPKS